MKKNENVLKLIPIFLCAIIYLFFSFLALKRWINPNDYSNYLYAYGYGLFARKMFIIVFTELVVFSILFIICFKFKRKFVNIVMTFMIILLFFNVFYLFVVAVKESRSIVSYTKNIENFGKYDEIVDFKYLENELPTKDSLIDYEYYLMPISSIFGTSYSFSMFVTTKYDQMIEIKANENEKYSEFKNDNNRDNVSFDLEDYKIYQYEIDYNTDSDRNYGYSELIIFISSKKDRIIYAVTNERASISSKGYYQNIYDYIDGYRDNPFYNISDNK
ncbi:hypothetical protein [Haploplasma axanthum]|nr:hypothetical protein [Haploplasma axanthum]